MSFHFVVYIRGESGKSPNQARYISMTYIRMHISFEISLEITCPKSIFKYRRGMKSRKMPSFQRSCALFAFSGLCTQLVQAQASCSGSFSATTASAFVDSLSPGWNLGNTLDAFPTEGSWNNPAVDSSTFDDVVNAGFKSVRVPGMSALTYQFTR